MACAAIVLALTSHLACADDAPRKIVEIYRIVPGQHEAFLKLIAEHTDTFVEGPTSAATWLRKLEP
jgi:hypothetical protein